MKSYIEDAAAPHKLTMSGEPFFREIQIEFLIHELKGPMSVVETGLRMLLEKKKTYGPLSPKQEKTLRRSLRNARKTRQMLGDLLEIGRSEAGCFLCSRFNPAEAVYDVLFETLELAPGVQFGNLPEADRFQESLPQFGIHIKIAPQLTDLVLEQDEKKFRQIFGNLIKNALHHRKERIDILINQTENMLCIDVGDDGPGIKPEHHAFVFRRYTQVNEDTPPITREGHGLGLAGAFILARCLGGNIELESESGKGATFRLVLPLRLEMGK